MLKKRVLSVLLCLCMAVGMLPWITPEASAATNGHTRDEAVAEARRRAQNPYDYDGVYGPQCVDLIWWYYQYLGYRSPGGDATINSQIMNGSAIPRTKLFRNLEILLSLRQDINIHIRIYMEIPAMLV